MNGYLEDKIIDDISLTKAYTILKEKNIIIKSLPGYGNLGLKKRDIKQYVKHGECSIKLQDQHVTLFNMYSLNSLGVNCFNRSFNCLYLSLLGFNA